jgi:16S rRNA (guanine527-N7)-methyltransferase
MDEARIAELLEPFLGPAGGRRLTANDLARISIYIDILLRWNARINLTAIRNPEQIVTRHFGESLFAARHLFPLRDHSPGTNREGRGFSRADATLVRNRALPPEGRANDQPPFAACPEPSEGADYRITLADVGSGAGFPGLPVKIWAPHISLTLIEANHKKATFLREVARALTLTDIDILTIRAEDLLKPSSASRERVRDVTVSPANAKEPQVEERRAAFNVITLRAVERFPDILPVAAALVAPTGRLALLIGTLQRDQVLTALGSFTWHPPILIPQSKSRLLIIGTREPRM